MNKTLQEIQNELKVWTEYNFGKQELIIPIMGMIEELGELSHAIFKEKQGIRQSDFLADKKDAIADLTIYALNYLNVIDKNYSENLQFANVDLIKSLQNISNLISTLATDLTNERYIHYSSLVTNTIILNILDICKTLDIDFLTTVNEVWKQVKLRDWKKYPKNGISE